MSRHIQKRSLDFGHNSQYTHNTEASLFSHTQYIYKIYSYNILLYTPNILYTHQKVCTKENTRQIYISLCDVFDRTDQPVHPKHHHDTSYTSKMNQGWVLEEQNSHCIMICSKYDNTGFCYAPSRKAHLHNDNTVKSP